MALQVPVLEDGGGGLGAGGWACVGWGLTLLTPNFMAQVFITDTTPNARYWQNLTHPLTKILDPHLPFVRLC